MEAGKNNHEGCALDVGEPTYGWATNFFISFCRVIGLGGGDAYLDEPSENYVNPHHAAGSKSVYRRKSDN
jgi:hypothetical protein